MATEASADDCTLTGGAARVGDGELELTSAGRFDVEGSAYCATSVSRGAPRPFGLTPPSGAGVTITTRRGAAQFEAAFSLRLDEQGEGVSFSYGELGGNEYAGGLGEFGTGFAGLRLRLRARAPAVLRVLYRTELLYEEQLPREITHQLGAAFVPIVISYGRGASGGGAPGLTLLLNGTARLRGLPVAAWAPQPSWRFGFGARFG